MNQRVVSERAIILYNSCQQVHLFSTGLDSSSCFQLISLLKSLARGGRTVICTIHQPSARLFEMFDQLYMLAEGQCIFEGVVSGLVPFLSYNGYTCPSYHNPADFVMEVACGEHGEAIHKLVSAVNNSKSNVYNHQPRALDTVISVVQTNDKIINSVTSVATSSVEPSSGIMTHDSVIVDVDLVKNASHPNEFTMATVKETSKDPQDFQQIGPSSMLLESSTESTESVLLTKKDAHKNHISGFPTSSWTQFWILLKRTFLTIIRDQTLTQMRLVSHVVVGAIIGMIYYGIGNDASKIMSNAGCLFFTTLFMMFTAMMPTILTFPTEMSVFIREHLNCWYSLKAYYFAKTIADLPFQVSAAWLTLCLILKLYWHLKSFQILFTSVYVIVVYVLTAQPLEADRIGMFVLICILTSLVAQSLGLLIGAGMSVETGVFLGPVSTIPTILFSGFFVNFNVIPNYLRWVTYVSYVRFGFEGNSPLWKLFERLTLMLSFCRCNDLSLRIKSREAWMQWNVLSLPKPRKVPSRDVNVRCQLLGWCGCFGRNLHRSSNRCVLCSTMEITFHSLIIYWDDIIIDIAGENPWIDI